jgi:hypothetical protein
MQPRPRADTSIAEVVPRVRVGIVVFIAVLSAGQVEAELFESRSGCEDGYRLQMRRCDDVVA